MAEISTTFTAMASDVTLRIVEPTDGAVAALAAARRVIEDVAASCTRFDPTSPLMRANAAPDDWHIVPSVCADAIAAAYNAYLVTDGRFDPRVLGALQRAGYAASREFSSLPELGMPVPPAVQIQPARWTPGFEGRRVRIGADPIDLGGIGKGLAVRWAAATLAGHGDGVLIDAGGDLVTMGVSPDGGAWHIGVENPWDAQGEPLVVLDASDAAVATSSIRLRSWVESGRTMHHLIDPRTGEPGGTGLVSVTVIGTDAADAEVWSKALFLEGAARIAALAEQQELAAIWIDVDGQLAMTAAAESRSIWQVAHAAH